MFKVIKKIYKQNIYFEYAYNQLKNLIYFRKNKNNPFGVIVVAKEETYRKIFNNSLTNKYPKIDEFENLHLYKIDKDWMNDVALHTQVTIKNSDICYQHGRILYSTLRQYILDQHYNTDDHINIVETGTARGFSSLCLAKALNDSGANGTIHSIDTIPGHKKFYWNCIDDIEGKKTRLELLNKWSKLYNKYIKFYEGNSIKVLKKLKLERVNFCFLDASHTYFDVKKEFKIVSKFQLKGDIVIFDDYTKKEFNGLIKAADEVTKKYGYANKQIQANQKRGYLLSFKN